MSLKTCVFVLTILSWWLAHIDLALAQAGGRIKCANGTTISASVPRGGCVVTGQKIECSNKSGDKAVGDCATLSCASEGNGSCSKARAPVGGKPTKPTPIATNPTSGSGVKPPPPGSKGTTKVGGVPPTTVGAKQRPSSGSSGPVLEEHPANGDGTNH